MPSSLFRLRSSELPRSEGRTRKTLPHPFLARGSDDPPDDSSSCYFPSPPPSLSSSLSCSFFDPRMPVARLLHTAGRSSGGSDRGEATNDARERRESAEEAALQTAKEKKRGGRKAERRPLPRPAARPGQELMRSDEGRHANFVVRTEKSLGGRRREETIHRDFEGKSGGKISEKVEKKEKSLKGAFPGKQPVALNTKTTGALPRSRHDKPSEGVSKIDETRLVTEKKGSQLFELTSFLGDVWSPGSPWSPGSSTRCSTVGRETVNGQTLSDGYLQTKREPEERVGQGTVSFERQEETLEPREKHVTGRETSSLSPASSCASLSPSSSRSASILSLLLARRQKEKERRREARREEERREREAGTEETGLRRATRTGEGRKTERAFSGNRSHDRETLDDEENRGKPARVGGEGAEVRKAGATLCKFFSRSKTEKERLPAQTRQGTRQEQDEESGTLPVRRRGEGERDREGGESAWERVESCKASSRDRKQEGAKRSLTRQSETEENPRSVRQETGCWERRRPNNTAHRERKTGEISRFSDSDEERERSLRHSSTSAPPSPYYTQQHSNTFIHRQAGRQEEQENQEASEECEEAQERELEGSYFGGSRFHRQHPKLRRRENRGRESEEERETDNDAEERLEKEKRGSEGLHSLCRRRGSLPAGGKGFSSREIREEREPLRHGAQNRRKERYDQSEESKRTQEGDSLSGEAAEVKKGRRRFYSHGGCAREMRRRTCSSSEERERTPRAAQPSREEHTGKRTLGRFFNSKGKPSHCGVNDHRFVSAWREGERRSRRTPQESECSETEGCKVEYEAKQREGRRIEIKKKEPKVTRNTGNPHRSSPASLSEAACVSEASKGDLSFVLRTNKTVFKRPRRRSDQEEDSESNSCCSPLKWASPTRVERGEGKVENCKENARCTESALSSPLARVRRMGESLDHVLARLEERKTFLDKEGVSLSPVSSPTAFSAPIGNASHASLSASTFLSSLLQNPSPDAAHGPCALGCTCAATQIIPNPPAVSPHMSKHISRPGPPSFALAPLVRHLLSLRSQKTGGGFRAVSSGNGCTAENCGSGPDSLFGEKSSSLFARGSSLSGACCSSSGGNGQTHCRPFSPASQLGCRASRMDSTPSLPGDRGQVPTGCENMLQRVLHPMRHRLPKTSRELGEERQQTVGDGGLDGQGSDGGSTLFVHARRVGFPLYPPTSRSSSSSSELTSLSSFACHGSACGSVDQKSRSCPPPAFVVEPACCLPMFLSPREGSAGASEGQGKEESADGERGATDTGVGKEKRELGREKAEGARETEGACEMPRSLSNPKGRAPTSHTHLTPGPQQSVSPSRHCILSGEAKGVCGCGGQKHGNLHRETGHYVPPFRPPCDPQRPLSPVRQGLRPSSALTPPSFYGAPVGNLGGGPECGMAGSGPRGATPSWSEIVSERRRASVASVPPSFPASPPLTFPPSPSFSLPCQSATHRLPPSPYFYGCAPGASCPATHQTRSDAKARSDRLLHILQRRSAHHWDHSRQQRPLSPTRKGGVGAPTSPVLRKETAVSSANAPHLLPSSAWPGGSPPVLPGISQRGSRSNEGDTNSGRHRELLEVPVKGRGSLEGHYFPRNVVWGQPARMADDNRFVAPVGSPVRTQEGGIAGSRLGPFGAKHLILTKLIDNLELARRQLKPQRETEKNRVSTSSSAVRPTAAPATQVCSGFADRHAVEQRGKDILNALNCRWRQFKASGELGTRSRETTEPWAADWHAHFVQKPRGRTQAQWGEYADQIYGMWGRKSDSFQMRIANLNQKMATVVGREYHLLYEFERAKKKWHAETTAEREGRNETTEKASTCGERCSIAAEGSPMESSECSQREGPSLVARSVELPVGVELRRNSRIVSAGNAASSRLALSGEEIVKDRPTVGVSGENEHVEHSSSSDRVDHASGERRERDDHRKQERKKPTNQRDSDANLSSSEEERSKAKANEKRHRRKSSSHGKEKGSARRHRCEETLMSFDGLLSRRVSAGFLRSASVASAAPPLRRDKWAERHSSGFLHSPNFDGSERSAPGSENDLPDIEQAEIAMAREWAARGRDKSSSLPSAARFHPSASGLFGEEIRRMGKNEEDMEQVILAREARTEDNIKVRKSARLDCLQQQELDLLDLIERRIKKQQEQNRKN